MERKGINTVFGRFKVDSTGLRGALDPRLRGGA